MSVGFRKLGGAGESLGGCLSTAGSLERFGELSANNLVGAIAKAREGATFSRLLTALGIANQIKVTDPQLTDNVILIQIGSSSLIPAGRKGLKDVLVIVCNPGGRPTRV